MVAFPKIEIKWDWVSDVHVYINPDAVIWFWKYCHVRTRQTSENQITDRKCVVQTNSRVKWRWFYSGMSEFNRLVVILFSAMFSCFLLDSFELQEMVSIVSQNMEPLSLRSTSRGVRNARLTVNMPVIRYFFPNGGNWRIDLWNRWWSHFARSVWAVIV